MSERKALVGESSPELRHLMRRSLNVAGYRVTDAGSPKVLVYQLHEPDVLAAPASLVVLSAQWHQQCAMALSAAASRRRQLRLPVLKIVLIHEWGTLGMMAPPALEHCEFVAMLEKPFELADLERIARSALTQVA